jgi:hypothetical protein
MDKFEVLFIGGQRRPGNGERIDLPISSLSNLTHRTVYCIGPHRHWTTLLRQECLIFHFLCLFPAKPGVVGNKLHGIDAIMELLLCVAETDFVQSNFDTVLWDREVGKVAPMRYTDLRVHWV